MLFATETETVDVVDDGKTYHVTIRKLNEGDRCDRLNLITRNRTVDGITGALFEFDLVRSVQSWDFPRALDNDALRELDPDTAAVIYKAIHDLNPSIFPSDRPTTASTAERTTSES